MKRKHLVFIGLATVTPAAAARAAIGFAPTTHASEAAKLGTPVTEADLEKSCHTVWGWKNDVPPGTFSEDVKKSAASLDRLEKLAARHPKMEVRVGHQIFH